MNKFESVIGLEVHIELATKSKMFCTCSADYFGAEPNTHTCPICLGLPGAMPNTNKLAIEFSQKLAMALNCQVQLSSKFDRKNYFYPDLAKGFQISQYDLPFSKEGYIEILATTRVPKKESGRKIGITRVHLEEDTGKLSHATLNGKKVTLIDFNRSGVPLMEVVSEPDIRSAVEAKAFAWKLQQIVRYLEISDADMEKGSMRIEPNVSLRDVSHVSKVLPSYKVELKNINSFKFAEKAINFEIERQSKILESGQIPEQETRGWDEKNNRTIVQRSKEFAHDYRYFPEPDLTPFTFSQRYLKQLKNQLIELPDAKIDRFQKKYQLSAYDTEILTRDVYVADYFEEAVKVGEKHQVTAKQIANTMINQKIDIEKILPAKLVQDIIFQTSMVHFDPRELEEIIKKVISQNPKAVKDYKSGKKVSLEFLIGQVQKEVKGRIDPTSVRELLLRNLEG